jgi:hypothetical protein
MSGDELDIEDQIDENEDGYLADLDEGDLDEGGPTAEDEGDLDEVGGEPPGEHGEVESLESEQLGETVSPGVMPPPPQGFTSWEEAYEAQARRAQAAEYQQQSLAYQQAQQAEARRHQSQGFAWELPHSLTPEIQMAMRLRGTKGYQELPQVVRSRAEEVDAYMQGHWQRWTSNPMSFVQEVVLPQVAPAIRNLTDQLAELKAAEFRRQNQNDLASQADVDRYLDMVSAASRDPYQTGLEMLRLKKALSEAQSVGQGSKTKTRDKQARSKSARGKPAQKGRAKGRRGKRKQALNKKESANPHAVAQAVMQSMLENGELTQSDLDG